MPDAFSLRCAIDYIAQKSAFTARADFSMPLTCRIVAGPDGGFR